LKIFYANLVAFYAVNKLLTYFIKSFNAYIDYYNPLNSFDPSS